MLIPNLFLGAGAMKSGTTWLYNVLSKQPDIYFTHEKEVHYFAHCHTSQAPLNDAARVQRAKQAIQAVDAKRARTQAVRMKMLWYGNYLSNPLDDSWYANLFSFRGTQRYCADFSNLYCHLDKAGWDHVKSVAGNLKVLYLMRDPLARLWSHIRFHLHVTGKFSELETWTEKDYLDFAHQPFIWPNGEYAANITRMRHNLSDRQLKVGFFEDLHRDPRAWLCELEDFLEVPRFDYSQELLSRRVNESPSAKMPEFFNDLFGDYREKELKRLADIGLIFPLN